MSSREIANGAAGAGSGTLPLPSRELRVIRAHEGPVFAVKFNKDGRYCMTAGADRAIRLWNPHRPAEAPAPPTMGALLIKSYTGGHGYEVADVAIASDNGRFASCGGDKPVLLWDVAEGRTIRKLFGHEARVNTVCFNADNSVLVSGSYDKSVRLWDCRSQSQKPIQVLSDARDSVTTVIAADDKIISSSIDGAIRTYDIRAGKLFTDVVHCPVSHVCRSNDQQCLLTSSIADGGTLTLVEAATGSMLNFYRGHANSAYPLRATFTYTDAYVVCGGEDAAVHFWDLVEGREVQTLKGHKRAVCEVAYHPSSHMLLSASFDGTVRVWDRVGS